MILTCKGNYIVDFYCKDLQLAIEIDGMSHDHEEAFAKDEFRQKRLENLGVIVIRFTESEMKNDMMNVIRCIEGSVIEIIKSNPLVKIPDQFDRGLLE